MKNDYWQSFFKDENVLELYSGDTCTTLWIYLKKNNTDRGPVFKTPYHQ
jgi:hypothetical protein